MCMVVGVFEAQTLTGAALEMDLATKGLVTRVIKAGDMSGKAGSTLFLHEVSGIGASRVLLVGLGKQDAFNQKAYGEAVRAAWRAMLGTKIARSRSRSRNCRCWSAPATGACAPPSSRCAS